MFTFGCDPEFVIKLENGNSLFPYTIAGGIRTKFGADGSLFEIRPGYSHDVLDVISSIHKILSEAYESVVGIRKLKWLCGHFQCDKELGGHVHIGGLDIKVEEEEYYDDGDLSVIQTLVYDGYLGNYNGFDDPCVRRELLVNLDVFKLVELLNIGLDGGLSEVVDDLESRHDRRSNGCDYGYPEAFRINKYVNKRIKHIEYRTPGSFLISPQIALLNLTIAKAITEAYFRDKKAESFIRKLKGSRKILSGIKEIMSESKEDDLKLGTDLLRDLLGKGWKIDWNDDFKKNWGLGK